MTVAELIEKLKTFPQGLTVCLKDWNEEYQEPDEGAAETMGVEQGEYSGNEDDFKGEFLQIG